MIGLDQVRNDRVRSDRVRSDRVRNDRVRNDRVRNDSKHRLSMLCNTGNFIKINVLKSTSVGIILTKYTFTKLNILTHKIVLGQLIPFLDKKSPVLL